MNVFTIKRVSEWSCSDERTFEETLLVLLARDSYTKTRLKRNGTVALRQRIRNVSLKRGGKGKVARSDTFMIDGNSPVKKQKKDIIVGIDPGFTGGIALYNTELKDVQIFDMPIQRVMNKRQVHAKELTKILRTVAPRISHVAIENVHAMPEQGVSSTFKFGFNAGILHGVCHALELSVLPIAPSVWKGALSLSKKKRESLDLANKLFPGHKESFKLLKHDGRAEAALIAHYADKKINDVVEIEPEIDIFS